MKKGKRVIHKRVFNPGEIINEVIASYEENYTSDEEFIEDCKVEWICKKKKQFHTQELDHTIVNDLIINNKKDMAEGQLEKAKDWTE